jgi:hypothetical protein
MSALIRFLVFLSLVFLVVNQRELQSTACDVAQCLACTSVNVCTQCANNLSPSQGGSACVDCTTTNCSLCNDASVCVVCQTGYSLNPNNNLCIACQISQCNYCETANVCY